jgi:hypothetical protein
MKKLPFFLLMFTLVGGMAVTGCKKKEGCTDPTSLNYDPEAEVDDGSCQYADPNATTYTDNGDGTITVDDKGQGTGTMTWSNTKEYILDGFVFVNSGQTLTIEAGTVVRGKPGTGENASALIVARGGKIIAEGTAANPIIFTALNDNLSSTTDIPLGTSGLWGGLMVLGKAKLNSTPGETAIEGIPTSEQRGLYGGTDDADNSGVLKYISIRYGGTDIGAGNEINGLTLGGVGSGTVVEHIEVMFNADDGVEFFGGTVGVKYFAAIFCQDDAIDYDEGFRGNGQFWFVLQGTVGGVDFGDRGGEHDGGTTPEDGTPYSHPVIYNATYLGYGESKGKRAVTFRDNAGGEYHNSIFSEYGKGIDVEMMSTASSYNRFTEGNLLLEDNVFWNVAGNSTTGIFKISVVDAAVTDADSIAAVANISSYFTTAGNTVENPGVVITYSTDGTLNPVPSTPPAAGTAPSGAWFDNVTYKGAFGSTNWLAGWSGTDALGFF